MRSLYAGGGLLSAALLLVLGVVATTGAASTPTAHAQTGCSEDVSCLTIAKEADPADTDDSFDFDSDLGDFSLDSGEEETFEVDTGETYTVTEAEMDGWTLVNIDCEDDGVSGVEIDTDEANGSLTVTFDTADDEFATVTCTFVNEMDDTPTPSPTATGTTAPTTTSTAVATATKTPVPPAPTVGGGSVRPPNTGTGGLK